MDAQSMQRKLKLSVAKQQVLAGSVGAQVDAQNVMFRKGVQWQLFYLWHCRENGCELVAPMHYSYIGRH